jgi:DNA-binding transcriptional ArsR family regulator
MTAPPAIDRVLAAMADPTRRRLLEVLAVREPASASALAHELPVSRQAVVKHLGILREAGLVEGGRTGREVRFSVRPAGLQAAARWMAALASDWDARLAEIKSLAESG